VLRIFWQINDIFWLVVCPCGFKSRQQKRPAFLLALSNFKNFYCAFTAAGAVTGCDGIVALKN
jgi:hypothetical protein